MVSNFHLLEQHLFEMLLQSYESVAKHELRRLHTYEEGQHVFKQDGTPRGIYFLKSGRAKVVRNASGDNPSMYRIAEKGEFIGFLSLIQKTPYQASAFAVESSEVWFVARNIFFQTLHSNIEFANGFVEMLCARLHYAEDHIDNLNNLNARQRLATAFLSLAGQENGYAGKREGFELMRKDLARIISVTPETLSRLLREFEAEQLVSIRGKAIDLLDVNTLLQISQLQD